MLEIILPSLSADKKRKYTKAFVDSDSEEEDTKNEVYPIPSYHTSEEGSFHGRGREEDDVGYASYDSLEDREPDRDKETEEYNSGDDFVPTKKEKSALKKKTVKKVKPPPEPPSKAKISVLAEPEANENARQALDGVDNAMLEKIKKALNLSRHPGTTEQEAQQALRLAMKLMEKCNITQAAVLATMEAKEDKLKQAGQSIVSVLGKPGSNMYVSQWSGTASQAVTRMFDCKYYTTSFSGWENMNRIDYIFYGLAANTVSAASAFEMVYNLIMAWRMANKEAKGINAKNAYCTGVADGLNSFSSKEKRRELKDAEKTEKRRLEAEQKAEEEQRRKEIARLQQPVLEEKEMVENKSHPKVDIEDAASSELSSLSGSESDRDDKSDFYDDDMQCGAFGDDSDSDYGYGGGDWDRTPDAEEEQGLQTEEARDMNAVASNFHVKDEVVEEIDLDKIIENSEQRIRDNPELADERKEPIDKKKDKKAKPVKAEETRVKPEVKPEPELEPKPQPKEEPESEWKSAGALIAFRGVSKSIAEDYLKTKGVKLRKGAPRKPLEFKDETARASYDQGWEDSKKIDLKQKRLKASEEDEVLPIF